MRKNIAIALALFFVFGFMAINTAKADTLSNRLKGRILLQVESKGEAWYVNPKDGKRYYMANGDEAYNIMRNLGVGITNKDLDKLKNSRNSALKQKGKIFLQVESSGEAYYVDFNGNLHYLQNGAEAYKAMRNLGLGISNLNLYKIPDQFSSQIETSNNNKKLTNLEIINKIKPAVVYIETTEGVGSGMIIDANGYILTNAHVVWDVSVAKIKLSDGRSLSAEVVGRDEIVDLAILKIVGTNFSKVIFGNSDNITQGEEVFTLGYPFGLEGDVSFKEGTISRRINDGEANYLETSAEIHPGNSGGPLVNKYGEVVGVNSASYGQSIKGVNVGETIKLAIPINVAKNLIPELKGGRKIVIDHKQYESESSTENPDVATDFAIKAQCSQLGQQKKAEDDKEYPLGGTTAYGYSPKLNTCIYGKLYLSELKSIGSLLFSGQLHDLMTGKQIFSEGFMVKTSASGTEKQKFLDQQKEITAKLWAIYDYYVAK